MAGMAGNPGCDKKESQVESEMKKLSNALSSLEERLPKLWSMLDKVLAPENSPPTIAVPPDKSPESLCPLSIDISLNAIRIRELTSQVEDILERIRL